MIDSDDVLLLRPVRGGLQRDDVGPGGRLLVTTYHLVEPAEHGFLETFTTAIESALDAACGRSAAVYVTEPSPNTWPMLPVREGEHVLVALRAFADAAEHRAFGAAAPPPPAGVRATTTVLAATNGDESRARAPS